jgi:uncharacterized protein (DUF697 family)
VAGLRSISSVWKNIGEVDLRPIREDALREIQIAIVGELGSGRQVLADHLRQDPSREGTRVETPILILDLDQADQAQEADLIIILVDAAQSGFGRQRELARGWTNSGKKVLVFYNTSGAGSSEAELKKPERSLDSVWNAHHLLVGMADDAQFLVKQLAPAVMRMLPKDLLPLARRYPLFRVPVANDLISDTSLSNAAYAFSTGLAEIVPILNIPLNVTDMIIITKAQAFLAYKLGLALGLSTRWQDYVREFGGVIGSGFLWRQLARSLIGLIPVIGIIPKAAVAYSGTFVVGQAILRWYLTGRHISPRQVRENYRLAYWRGRATALDWFSKSRRLRLPRRGRAKAALAASQAPPSQAVPPAARTCPNCGRENASDAMFCQYCGQPLALQSVE